MQKFENDIGNDDADGTCGSLHDGREGYGGASQVRREGPKPAWRMVTRAVPHRFPRSSPETKKLSMFSCSTLLYSMLSIIFFRRRADARIFSSPGGFFARKDHIGEEDVDGFTGIDNFDGEFSERVVFDRDPDFPFLLLYARVTTFSSAASKADSICAILSSLKPCCLSIEATKSINSGKAAIEAGRLISPRTLDFGISSSLLPLPVTLFLLIPFDLSQSALNIKRTRRENKSFGEQPCPSS